MRTGRTLIPIALAAVLGVGCSGVTAPTAATSAVAPSQAASSRVPSQAVSSGAQVAASPQVAGQVTSPPATDEPGTARFATPEDAIRAYLAGVAQADVTRILQACAIDEMSAGFRFDRYVDRLKAMLLFTSLAPAGHPFYVALNRAQQSAQILTQVRALTYSLLSTETIDGSTITPADKARADKFIQEVDPARLADLKVVDIRFSNANFEHDARYLANTAASAATYGADEMTERLALFSFEGKYYFVGFTVLRYGDDWKISSQVANLANTPVLGTPEQTTVEEFDRLTSGG